MSSVMPLIKGVWAQLSPLSRGPSGSGAVFELCPPGGFRRGEKSKRLVQRGIAQGWRWREQGDLGGSSSSTDLDPSNTFFMGENDGVGIYGVFLQRAGDARKVPHCGSLFIAGRQPCHNTRVCSDLAAPLVPN